MFPQFRLRVLPKLLLQSLIPRRFAAIILHPHRFIIRSIDQILPPHRRSPRLIQRPTLRTLEVTGKPEEEYSKQPQACFRENVRAQRLKQIRKNHSWMYRDRRNLRISLRKLTRKQQIAQLRLPVPFPRVLLLERRLVENEAARDAQRVACAAQRHNAGVATGLRGGCEQRGEEQFCE